MLYLYYFFIRIIEKIASHFHLIFFYNTNIGLKNFGACYAIGGKPKNSGILLNISAENLYLGPDFLKDNYTLLETPLSESPHFGLMLALQNNKDIRDTEYFQRIVTGKLDWRRARPMPKDLNYFYKKYESSLNKIMDEAYDPIIVYKLDKRYYIYDGKHRAALCYLLGKPVKCIILGSEIANSDIWHYMFSIVNNQTCYKKHIIYHNNYLNSIISVS